MGEIIIVVVCLGINALLAAYEMAFVSVTKSELRSLARNGSRQAQTLLTLRDNPERTLSVIQVGITFVGAIAAAVGGAGASDSIEPFLVDSLQVSESLAEAFAVMLVVIPLSYLSVVIGELVPKSLALRDPRSIVFAGAGVLSVADRILSPVVSVLEVSTKFILQIFFPKKNADDDLEQTNLELDSLSPKHRRFVLNMANIEKKLVKDIMVPWSEVNHVSINDSIEEVAHVVLSSGHTRLPVRDNGKVAGVLHTKEFMSLRESGDDKWINIVRPVLKVNPLDSAFALLCLMQDRRSHLAVVLSHNGDRAGIVTLEDIVEEVIGDIFDEDDDGKVRKIFITRTKDKNRL
jgi:putative hemolysin